MLLHFQINYQMSSNFRISFLKLLIISNKHIHGASSYLIHSMQGWTAPTRHGVTIQRHTKRLKHLHTMMKLIFLTILKKLARVHFTSKKIFSFFCFFFYATWVFHAKLRPPSLTQCYSLHFNSSFDTKITGSLVR